MRLQTISSRHRSFFMRRFALCATVLVILGCGGGSSSPSEPASCTNVAGSYRASAERVNESETDSFRI